MSTPRKPRRPAPRAIITNQLRSILGRDEYTWYAIARDSGVPISTLRRFLGGERDIRVATLDQLAEVLGLRLVETGRIKIRESKSPRPGSRVRAIGSEPLQPPQVVADDTSRTVAHADGQDD